MVTHPVVLRGLGFTREGEARPTPDGAPQFIQRLDADFVARFFDELGDDVGLSALAGATVGPRVEGGLKLYQPVHRIIYLTVFEVVCDLFSDPLSDAAPRLDPDQIESAGIVVRRTVGKGHVADDHEAWLRSRGKGFYWAPLGDADELDPDPARWERSPRSENAKLILERLAGEVDPADAGEEHTALLYPAPPAVCERLGRTVLFGVVPVASSDAEGGPQPERPRGYTTEEIADPVMLPVWFHAGPPLKPSLVGIADRTYTFADVQDLLDPARAMPEALDRFVKMLRQMVAEFDAFSGESEIVAALDELWFGYNEGDDQRVGAQLKLAASLFVHGDEAVTFKMPARWPDIPAPVAQRILLAAQKAAGARLAQVLPRVGRFDAQGARYQVRGFVRVRRPDGCPPKIVWSRYSDPFKIAPWHEASGLPPVQISLPAVTKLSARSLLPNVAFNVPKGIFDLLQRNKPEDFLKGQAKGDDAGQAKGDGASGIDWICAFNIPIITLCAFIVLNIFLQLLNIVFWWLAFIKICIPVPKALKDKLPNGVAP
ncbi:hypothetical protein [Sorangium sp. So ce388]|uniref:hypothetical protein n=1 Tax=Sorangium sp. So ce388 TaxID=3133309 RepID=UPI003F5C3094